MKIATVFFCEYAATTREGKLDAGGILNAIWDSSFPMTVKQLTLIITIELDSHEYGAHSFSLKVEGPANRDENPVVSKTFDAGGRFHRIGINLEGLVFASPGLYQFHLYIDGAPTGDVTLIVHDQEPVYPV